MERPVVFKSFRLLGGVSWGALAVAGVLLVGCSESMDGKPVYSINGEARTLASGDYHQRGVENLRQGRIGLALDDLRLALKETPDSVEVLNALAVAYDQLHRFDVAREYYNRSLAIDPNSTQTLNNYGLSLLRQGHKAEAETMLARAEGSDAEAATAKANLAKVRYQVGGAVARGAMPQRNDDRKTAASAGNAWVERTTPTIQTLVTRTEAASEAEQVAHVQVASVPEQLRDVAAADLAVAYTARSTTELPPIATPAVDVAPRPVIAPAPVAELAPEAAPVRVAAVAEPANAPIVAVIPRNDAEPAIEAVVAPAADPVRITEVAPGEEPVLVQVAEAAPMPAIVRGSSAAEVTPIVVPVAASAPVPEIARVSSAAEVTPVAEAAPVEEPAPVRVAVAVPQSEPAPEPAAATPAVAPPSTFSFEVANGAGRSRMAARLARYLGGEGLPRASLNNADHFRYQSSELTYRPNFRAAAERVAARLPRPVDLIETDDQRCDVRLRLGGDLLGFDAALLKRGAQS